MADGFDLLEQDHRALEREFETFRHDEEGSVARELCEHVTRHTRLEEAAVHPALRRYVDGGDDLADREQAELATVTTMIAEIYDSATPERIPELVASLRRAMTAHVEATESEIFPAMRSCGVSPEQLAVDLDAAEPGTKAT